jgi:hypothetical protein
MTSLTRGPLPPGVYWRRRLLVLGLAVGLVVVFARVLGGGSDGSSDDDPDDLAQQVAGTPTADPTDDPSRKPGGKKSNKPTTTPTPTETPLPTPTGSCTEDDILIQPVVDQAVADSDVMIVLQLRTRVAEACTWDVSASNLALKITSGSDDIWSSIECPRAIPVKEVVVRQDHTSTLGVIWTGARRSDQGCTQQAGWALPGYYHVAAAPLGGEPVDVQFRLAAPTPEVITQTPNPTPNGGKQTQKPSQSSNPGGQG